MLKLLGASVAGASACGVAHIGNSARVQPIWTILQEASSAGEDTNGYPTNGYPSNGYPTTETTTSTSPTNVGCGPRIYGDATRAQTLVWHSTPCTSTGGNANTGGNASTGGNTSTGGSSSTGGNANTGGYPTVTNTETTTTVAVTGTSSVLDKDAGLSDGNIAAIVLACVAFLIFLCACFPMKIRYGDEEKYIDLENPVSPVIVSRRESVHERTTIVEPEVEIVEALDRDWVRHVVVEDAQDNVTVVQRRSCYTTDNSPRNVVYQPIYEANAVPGMRVVRGPDSIWTHGDQDGGKGRVGVLVAHLKENWWIVNWEAGSTHAYKLTELSGAAW